MKFELENDRYTISGVSASNENDKCKLIWNSDKFIDQAFIVIKGSNADEIMLSDASLRHKIEVCENELLQNKKVIIGSLTIFYVSFSDKIENGGFYIEKSPAFYAVYGCVLNGILIDTVYYGSKNKSTHINVSIDVEQSNFYSSKKGLFGSKRVYSGYKEIRIKNGIKNMPNKTVYYEAGGKIFFVPKEAFENGAAFYILCEENDKIEFRSKNSAIEVRQ